MPEYLVNDRLVSGRALELHQVFPNCQHTLMRPIFLGETLLLLGAAVIDVHNVHRAIANVGQHIDAPEVTQMISHGGKALGKNIHSGKVNMIGNAPRRCHNCGQYFLLTAGYNICYCNNIAPGETKRTCRKVGAHRKEAQGKANRSPTQKEYDRVYNRLKVRKQRGKISADEWNAAVARAHAVLDLAECGDLSDEETRRRFEAF